MRTLCTSIVLTLCSSAALAADFGLGVSARSDDAWIFAPINVGKSFRIEPSVRYRSHKTSAADRPASAFLAVKATTKLEELEFGVGIFGVTKIMEAAQFYYGGRLAYLDRETTSTRILSDDGVALSGSRQEISQDGYRIGPAIGFEYLVGEHFSIGGEASYSFVDLDGNSTYSADLVPSSYPKKEKTSGTTTQVIFRYMF